LWARGALGAGLSRHRAGRAPWHRLAMRRGLRRRLSLFGGASEGGGPHQGGWVAGWAGDSRDSRIVRALAGPSRESARRRARDGGALREWLGVPESHRRHPHAGAEGLLAGRPWPDREDAGIAATLMVGFREMPARCIIFRLSDGSFLQGWGTVAKLADAKHRFPFEGLRATEYFFSEMA